MRYVSALSILIAAVQAGIVAALGANIAGFALPPVVTFALMVSGAMLAVVSANLPAVALNGHLALPPRAE